MASPNDDGADPADLANEQDFDLHHPHDHFFRRMFGTAETASGYFLRVVPVALRPFVADPGRMRLENVSFISEDLRGSQSDLLWRCNAGEGRWPVYIYVLFEHQRAPDPMMVVRLLFYIVKIWERHLAQGPASESIGRLPFILPLVLYQGQTPWNSPLFLRDLVEVPGEELRCFVPDFTYGLESLQGTDLEGVNPDTLRLILLVMKLAGQGAAASGLALVCQEIERLPDGGQRGSIDRVALLYLFASARPEERKIMIKELGSTKVKVAHEARSALEALILDGIEEGMEKGMEKGREEGLNLALERLLAAGIDPVEARRMLRLE